MRTQTVGCMVFCIVVIVVLARCFCSDAERARNLQSSIPCKILESTIFSSLWEHIHQIPPKKKRIQLFVSELSFMRRSLQLLSGCFTAICTHKQRRFGVVCQLYRCWWVKAGACRAWVLINRIDQSVSYLEGGKTGRAKWAKLSSQSVGEHIGLDNLSSFE